MTKQNKKRIRGKAERFTRKLKYIAWRLIRKAKQVSFIGFDGVPVYNVVRFFVKGLIKGSITTRASAIAFDFFIAIFPTIIFVFTLIPYIPVENFQEQLLGLLEGIIPDTAYRLVGYSTKLWPIVLWLYCSYIFCTQRHELAYCFIQRHLSHH